MAKLKFHRRASGTGGVLNTVILGLDDGVTHIDGEYRQTPDPVLTKIEARFHFFPYLAATSEATFNEARRIVVAELERLRSECNFKPIAVKTLARGLAVIPNTLENFGDLVYVTTSGDTIVLANCCLMDAAIVEDSAAINGITIALTFGRVCDSLTP